MRPRCKRAARGSGGPVRGRRAPRVLAAGALAAFLLAVGPTACRPLRPPWEGATFWVLAGNRQARNGDSLGATWRYHRALEALEEGGREPGAPRGGSAVDRGRVAYDLAGVYSALGELEAALRMTERALEHRASQGGDAELLFRASFNLGLLEYALGRYSQAAAACIRALQVKPGSWPAKVNLELCLKRMQAAASTPRSSPGQPPASAPRAELAPGDRAVLDALRRKEKTVWQTGESPSGPQQDW